MAHLLRTLYWKFQATFHFTSFVNSNLTSSSPLCLEYISNRNPAGLIFKFCPLWDERMSRELTKCKIDLEQMSSNCFPSTSRLCIFLCSESIWGMFVVMFCFSDSLVFMVSPLAMPLVWERCWPWRSPPQSCPCSWSGCPTMPGQRGRLWWLILMRIKLIFADKDHLGEKSCSLGLCCTGRQGGSTRDWRGAPFWEEKDYYNYNGAPFWEEKKMIRLLGAPFWEEKKAN